LPQSMGGDGELQECAYGTVARHVDNWAYVLYQRDAAPGHSLSTEACDMANNAAANDIVFVKIEAATVSVPTIPGASRLEVSQNYPNPVIGATAFNVSLTERSDITVQVTDLIGKVVYSTSRTNAASGIHTIQFSTSNWNDGIYFYTVQAQGQKITKQIVVQ
ncbi:MAG TPA: T9SS type A sorting domain-containing protein, partial [Bacteroidia bacterium]|nr:T9SS type A sorting domain-containing protein [Bacteroidia bacterium]